MADTSGFIWAMELVHLRIKLNRYGGPTMALPKRYAKKRAIAKRRLNAKARHLRQQQEAQRAIDALHQALLDVGLPDPLVAEIEGRLKAQKKLLSKVFGLMFPTLFGCTSIYELTRVRGWDKNLPSRVLGALPKRSWIKRLRKLGQDILVPLWRHTQSMSAATQSRWQWSWVWDDTVFRKYGQDFELVGRWYSGQHKQVVSGIDGVLLVVVIGDGKLIVPVDFAVRRPDPKGPGARCHSKLTWAQTMLDESLQALIRRGLRLHRPLAVADSWFSDSKLMHPIREQHQGVFLVQGKSSYAFSLPNGRKIKGKDLLRDETLPWRQSLDAPGCRYARLRARSAIYGEVVLIAVDKAGEDRFYLMTLEQQVPSTRLLRLWSRRTLIEQVFRTLKSLLATDACQVRSENAYYGHLVLRLMASFVLHYTSRVLFQGQVSIDEMIFNVKHHWASVDCEPLELYGLS